MEFDSEKNNFQKLGTFSVEDAERILKRFEETNIRFQIDPDYSRLRNMNPITASLGGYYGAATSIEIFVHRKDEETAQKILAEVLKICT